MTDIDNSQHYEVDVRIRGARYFDVFRDIDSATEWADLLWSVYEGSYFNGDTNVIRRREGALPWEHSEPDIPGDVVRLFDPTDQDPT